MKNSYDDIRGPLGEPEWFDHYGVPRYCAFHPRRCGVYRAYVAYAEIACQDCGRRFRVAVERDAMPLVGAPKWQFPTASVTGSFHYGDPPIHSCIGDTMNCITMRIMQFWRRDSHHDWVRDALYELEYPLDDPTTPTI